MNINLLDNVRILLMEFREYIVNDLLVVITQEIKIGKLYSL